MKLNEFEEKLLTSFCNFINTMKSHTEMGKREDLTYADWFDMFRVHEDVGNDLEVEYHGQRALDVHRSTCQLCVSSLATKSSNGADGLSRSVSSRDEFSPTQTCTDCHKQFWMLTTERIICGACLARCEQECEQ